MSGLRASACESEVMTKVTFDKSMPTGSLGSPVSLWRGGNFESHRIGYAYDMPVGGKK